MLPFLMLVQNDRFCPAEWLFILRFWKYTLSFAFLPCFLPLRTSNVQNSLRNRTVMTPKIFNQTYSWLHREFINFVSETCGSKLQMTRHPLAWISKAHSSLYKTRLASSLWNLKHWEIVLPGILSRFWCPWLSGKQSSSLFLPCLPCIGADCIFTILFLPCFCLCLSWYCPHHPFLSLLFFFLFVCVFVCLFSPRDSAQDQCMAELPPCQETSLVVYMFFCFVL